MFASVSAPCKGYYNLWQLTQWSSMCGSLHFVQIVGSVCAPDVASALRLFIKKFLPRCMECRRGLAMRILSVCLSVRPSVRLSHAWIVICPDLYTIRKIIYPSFFEKKNGWWGATPSRWNCGSTDPRWSEIADFQPIIARSFSVVTPSEKSSINANRKSNTRFPMSLKRSLYVAPMSPKGASKTQNGRFPLKNTFRLKKVCYKVSLCENCQRQSCKAFIGLTNRAKKSAIGVWILSAAKL